MNWILLNIPLGAVMVAFTVGLPLWVMLKYPDGDDIAIAHTAAPLAHEYGAAHDHGAVRELAALTA
jgi:hypothetical protein